MEIINEIDKYIIDKNINKEEIINITKKLQRCVSKPELISELNEDLREIIKKFEIKDVMKYFQKKNSEIISTNKSYENEIRNNIIEIFNESDDNLRLNILEKASKSYNSNDFSNLPAKFLEFINRNKEHNEIILKVINNEINNIIKKIESLSNSKLSNNIIIKSLCETGDILNNILYIIIKKDDNVDEIFYHDKLELTFESLENISSYKGTLKLSSYLEEIITDEDVLFTLSTKSMLDSLNIPRIYDIISKFEEISKGKILTNNINLLRKLFEQKSISAINIKEEPNLLTLYNY